MAPVAHTGRAIQTDVVKVLKPGCAKPPVRDVTLGNRTACEDTACVQAYIANNGCFEACNTQLVCDAL